MAKYDIILQGTEDEQQLFTEVLSHYTLSLADLQQRISRKNGFDDADKMFASYIDEASWPYRSTIFEPYPYTVILEKSARLIGGKPKGRLVPREGGDSLGAYINNELLDYQWEDNSRLGQSMISKWIMMDQNTRKYGSSFALVDWHYEKRPLRDEKGNIKREVFYDGPNMVVLNNRQVLVNPSYEYIKNWFQYIDYVTLQDLKNVNDYSRGEPVYKNLDLLAGALRDDQKGKGDSRTIQSKNKQIKGLQETLGQDEYNKVIEVVCERRPDKWIKIARRYGVVIQEIDNPYRDGSLHVIHLKYYPLPDDIYGVSELEPVSKQIRALNAHSSAYNDAIALALRPPVHVNPVNVRMHTLDWSPEAKWLMNNPNADVQVMKIDTSITQNYQSIRQALVGSLMNALGEQSQQMSAANPFQAEGNVTATEIRDTAFTRNVRDNMNKIFLSEALKEQIMLWHVMNQQFMFTAKADQLKIIRIVGRDAIEFFTRQGLSDIRPTEEDAMMAQEAMMMGQEPPEIIPGPRYAVNVGEDENGAPLEVPKYMPDENGGGGNLIIEPGDLAGNYNYIPDIESMSAPSQEQIEQKLMAIIGLAVNPVVGQQLAQEGKYIKMSDLIVKAFEVTNVIKDAEAYIGNISDLQNQMGGGMNVQGQINPGGVAPTTGGTPTQGNVPNGGMAPSAVPSVGGSNQIGSSGPAQVPVGI